MIGRSPARYDPADMSGACTDVNGGENANCDARCEKRVFCGDGVRDGPYEECDCGWGVGWIPATCDAPNGDDPDATCDASCNAITQCQEPGSDGSCDILFSDHCCDDDWGAEVLCHTAFENPTCSRACDESMACYWGNYCEIMAGGGEIDGGHGSPSRLGYCALPPP